MKKNTCTVLFKLIVIWGSAIWVSVIWPSASAVGQASERQSERQKVPSVAVIPAVLTVDRAWIRLMPPGSTVTAVYFEVTNHDTVPIELVGVQADWATAAAFHQTTREQGRLRMAALDTVTIAPAETLRFQPGGKHIMVTGVHRSLTAHMRLSLTLDYRRQNVPSPETFRLTATVLRGVEGESVVIP